MKFSRLPMPELGINTKLLDWSINKSEILEKKFEPAYSRNSFANHMSTLSFRP